MVAAAAVAGRHLVVAVVVEDVVVAAAAVAVAVEWEDINKQVRIKGSAASQPIPFIYILILI